MRRFNIAVNGQSYDVTVDEVGGIAPAAPVAAAPAAAAPTPASAPAAAPAPAPAAASAAVPANATKVNAPMPGNILAVRVNVGDTVKEGDVLVVLEAMKMENDITSPVGGKVVSIGVQKGDVVSTGALMVVIG